MGTFVLQDCDIYVNQFDVTADVTSVKPALSRDEVKATTYGSGGYHEFKAGLAESEISLSTFYEGDLIDSTLRSLEGVSGTVFSVPVDGVFDGAAIFGSGIVQKMERGFTIGDMAMLDGHVRTSGREGLIMGRTLVPKAAKTSTGSGAASQLGLVAAGQSVWATLHIFAVSGTTPSLTVKLQSDDNSGFTSPTDRITFTTANAVGAEYKSLAGAIASDNYWRLTWTITGTSPSFTIAACVGIQ